jgi:hypothetical protein
MANLIGLRAMILGGRDHCLKKASDPPKRVGLRNTQMLQFLYVVNQR